jgi:hypothetical protein
MRTAEDRSVRLYAFRAVHWLADYIRDPADPSRRFREITFASPDKIEALIARTPTRMILEDKQAFEHGIRGGLGAVTLMLTETQYLKLLC